MKYVVILTAFLLVACNQKPAETQQPAPAQQAVATSTPAAPTLDPEKEALKARIAALEAKQAPPPAPVPVQPVATPQQNPFAIVQCNWQFAPLTGGQSIRYIGGVFKNLTNKQYSRVVVNINLYNGMGVQISTHKAEVENVQPFSLCKFATEEISVPWESYNTPQGVQTRNIPHTFRVVGFDWH